MYNHTCQHASGALNALYNDAQTIWWLQ